MYSAQLGSDIGDWDFNWVCLEDEDGILYAVSCVPLQQKRRNIPPLQIGNNLPPLVAFDGAQALTAITIDASTWQHDFTVRLAGIDERAREYHRDLYGRACFFGEALRLSYDGSRFMLSPGIAYIEGLRVNARAVSRPHSCH
ncbi:phage tail-collar fiber domain-containing protein [Pseudomonas sp. RT6P73]